MQRKPMETSISLDLCYPDIDNSYNYKVGKSAEDELMESELLDEILNNLSEMQRNILKLKLEGYSNKEVFILLNVPVSSYYNELEKMKMIYGKIVEGKNYAR